MSDLEAFAKALHGSANLYERMCEAVETLKHEMDLRLKSPDKRLIVVGEASVKQAKAMCQKHDADLPEIHDKDQLHGLEQLMTEHKNHLNSSRSYLRQNQQTNHFQFQRPTLDYFGVS